MQLTVYAGNTTPTGTTAIAIYSQLGVKATAWFTAISLTPEH